MLFEHEWVPGELWRQRRDVVEQRWEPHVVAHEPQQGERHDLAHGRPLPVLVEQRAHSVRPLALRSDADGTYVRVELRELVDGVPEGADTLVRGRREAGDRLE